MFENIVPYAGDPILSLAEDFKKDARVEKVNLGIGLYHDENGKVPQLEAVQKAKEIYFKNNSAPSTYLPMDGLAPFCHNVRSLIFDMDSTAIEGRLVATVQTLGGAGALSLGATFLHSWYPDSTVYVSDPTWDNHISIFESAGIEVKKYPYYNAITKSVDFEAMCDFLGAVPEESIVLLHPCCHNPTGCDLTNEQWDDLITILSERRIIPFFDIAYQGLGVGIEEDAYAIKAMEKSGLQFIVSQSMSKIFSLYGERVGALSIVCGSSAIASNVQGQLKLSARRSYSSPPAYGAHLVNIVLGSSELHTLWAEELDRMRNRILDMRTLLLQELSIEDVDPDIVSYLVQQKGMFSYTGLTKSQVRSLRENDGIYLVENGRICLAGLNDENIRIVAAALAKCMHRVAVTC